MRTATGALVALTLLVIAAGPGQAAEPAETSRLTIEVDDQARQGEAHPATLLLTDARGGPLAGRTIAVSERVRLFDYADTVPIGEVRTDYRGMATLTHMPTVPGSGLLTAEFAGDERYGASTATVTMQIEEGISVPTALTAVRPEPLLPRGVTAVWFVPLLAGVWLAISAAIYQLVRIPGARGGRDGT